MPDLTSSVSLSHHAPAVDTPSSVRATGAGASRPGAGPRVGIGWIVAGSLAAGLAAAVLLIIAPLVPATDTAVTGAVLCGFGLGWAMVAVLSMRFTDQPQRWAAAPALLMALSGVLLLGAPAVDPVLDWVWPPAALAVAIGMAVGAHRRLRGRSRRWLLYPVIAMLALASIGGGYDTVQEAVDATSNTMPGQLIDVGGHRLHLNCTGSGAPTVVLEPGAGGMSSSLGWITPGVARDTRVCVYDRAGRGWSEPADTPQHAAQIATDLHELLQRGHVPGPYVLAGHSFGGLYVLTFAARYPTRLLAWCWWTPPHPRPSQRRFRPARNPEMSRIVSPRWFRPRRESVWAACSAGSPQTACRLSTTIRCGPDPPAPPPSAAPSTNTARAAPRGSKPRHSRTSPTSRSSCSPPATDTTPPGQRRRTTWPPCRPTASTASSPVRPMQRWSEEKPAAATTQAILDVVSAVRHPGPLRK